MHEEEIIIDMKQTYEHGREQNQLNIGLDDPAEWIYKKTTKGAEPTLTRQSEIALVEGIEMGKDGSHERCCVCGSEHRQRDPLMKCDYCLRVAHQKTMCGNRYRNHRIPCQWPACKESGNYTMTEEATEYWNKKEGKKQLIKSQLKNGSARQRWKLGRNQSYAL